MGLPVHTIFMKFLPDFYSRTIDNYLSKLCEEIDIWKIKYNNELFLLEDLFFLGETEEKKYHLTCNDLKNIHKEIRRNEKELLFNIVIKSNGNTEKWRITFWDSIIPCVIGFYIPDVSDQVSRKKTLCVGLLKKLLKNGLADIITHDIQTLDKTGSPSSHFLYNKIIGNMGLVGLERYKGKGEGSAVYKLKKEADNILSHMIYEDLDFKLESDNEKVSQFIAMCDYILLFRWGKKEYARNLREIPIDFEDWLNTGFIKDQFHDSENLKILNKLTTFLRNLIKQIFFL